jgi:hypothetical protein
MRRLQVRALPGPQRTQWALRASIRTDFKKDAGAIWPPARDDFVMPPLEGLWWAEDPAPVVARRGEWRWTMMNMQPDCIGADMVTGALEEIGREEVLPALPDLRFALRREGLSHQIMHIGSYEAEDPTLAKAPQR